MVPEKQLLRHINLERLTKPFQTIWSSTFNSEKGYLQVVKIQDSCQSSQKWTFQQIQPKIRLCNAQRNTKKKPKRNTAFKQKHLISIIKHSGGGVIIWACSAESELTMRYTWDKCETICLKNKALRKLGHATGQRPKAQQQLHQNGWKNIRMKVLEWPSHHPDLNPSWKSDAGP